MPYKNIEITVDNYNSQRTSAFSQFYRGFSTVDPINYGGKLYDFDLVKQDILNQFNTRKGERLMNPAFGTIIWDLLMEPLTEEVSNLLIADINEIVGADPRVYPTQIELNEYEQGFIVELTLNLKNTNQSSTLRLAFDQSVGLQVQ
jgi:phage baseplate assembly protein W